MASKSIPPWGRTSKQITAAIGGVDVPTEGDNNHQVDVFHGKQRMGSPQDFSPDIIIGPKLGPSVPQARMMGDMPNWPRMARGRLIAQRGKHTGGNDFAHPPRSY